MIRRGLETYREAGVDAVVVLVDSESYSRFGFERASESSLGTEYGADEAFIVKPVHERAIDDVAGTVTYRPASPQTET